MSVMAVSHEAASHAATSPVTQSVDAVPAPLIVASPSGDVLHINAWLDRKDGDLAQSLRDAGRIDLDASGACAWRVGERTYRIHAQRWFDEDPVVWVVSFEETTQERRLVEVQRLIDELPVSVIVSQDAHITYMNEACIEMLEPVEALLPRPARELKGICFDVFHKKPSYQRGLVADPSNLPHEATIDVGDEKLWFAVHPFYDADGTYAGQTLVLEFVTQKHHQLATLEETIDGVQKAVYQLRDVADDLAAQVDENSRRASEVSGAAEQIRGNINAVAAATQQLSASISDVSRSSSESVNVANNAVTQAESASELMAQLGASSAEIGKVIKVITSIAQQTNLLALNATIEAARAGEAGKGFAVVANEVKELAKETANATEDISQKIETIQGDTTSVVEAIERVSEVIAEISDRQISIASAVEEQTTTTDDIGASAQHAASNSDGIAERIAEVAESANANIDKIRHVRTSADDLMKIVEGLRETVLRMEASG